MAERIDWRQLELREKIGQLFMCGFAGTEPDEGILELIRKYGIGGVIYFRRNLKDAAQVAALSERLQAAAKTPLFLSIDQEGGMVVRLEEGVTVMPGAMAQGAADDERLTFEAAKQAAAELRAIGINMNFAPCLDVNNNPRNPVIGVRSYGEDPAQVARLGSEAAAGYQSGGVAAVAKHFPGHGDTASDSHYELPVVPHDRERLDQVELVPFRKAIERGVDSIMTAHVVFPAFEEDGVPATLSRRILTGLLREQLGFEGVIVTDCLEMNAISETIGVARGAVQAIQAGADLVLVSHRIDRQIAALEAVLEAVHAGEIPESRIDDAVERIWKLKESRGLFGDIAQVADRAAAGEVARRLSEKAVTVVKGRSELPLPKNGTVTVIWTEARKGTEVIEVIAQRWTLGAALEAEGYAVREVRIGIEPTHREAESCFLAAEGSGTVVFVSYDAGFSPAQSRLIHALAERPDRKFALVAGRTPYDLLTAPDVPVYLCAYENKPLMMSAVAGVLSGRLSATARLPVTIGRYHRGS
ncbi:beta-N-acetylhexosaminidase [Cohnella sp. CFH 77786]|uniref:beta-N-acetylhexosaminidase n=1 Tax=Cohnella sp. CFH 77786 TaxID=2662265 RepID=UPI001C608436|nr:beta-N-acetylhexosaminidase [Cohnella sp. CFH 77786]MBW5445016.1 beta-N-acetylhexosaminidase [Cohnella sp. CFH 77786]